ncbi:recombinase family protein [Bradyrhizobium tunisiense]|uniref:recombinase family protein n=1 Tax=Bradyrhizobium tunisiense TaxID=3278709 RepID=UPI0035E08D1B
MIYGCARVSTGGQSLAGQLDALGREAGCIFAEKISGAKSNRPQLEKLLRSIRAGGVVIVTRLDRMARSTRDLLNILARLEEKKAGFRSLSDPWADTTTPLGRLLVVILGGVAEFERELILARTAEGRARAVAQGVKLGRPRKLTSRQAREAKARLAAGGCQTEVARSFGGSPSTISRLPVRSLRR